MDPHIFHRPFKRQLKKLVLEPLQQLSLQGVIYPTVVIIDGLDECLNHDERTILLRAISIATAQYPVRCPRTAWMIFILHRLCWHARE